MQIADSNFVLRYLLKDIADQFASARSVLESETVYIPFEVMAEVVYVLQSVYGVADAEIATSLSALLTIPTSRRDLAPGCQYRHDQRPWNAAPSLLSARAKVIATGATHTKPGRAVS